MKKTLKVSILGVFAFLMVPPSGWTSAKEVSLPFRDIKTLIGESLEYDISFLWFERLAEAHLSFKRGDREGTFRAVLEARTLGIAAWLTGNRRQQYVASMELGKSGRFRTLKYESLKMKGKGEKTRIWKKSYIFDYKAKKINHIRFTDGRETKRTFFPMTGENPPADILTNLYNFRRGMYGRTMTQKPLIVPTFARGGDSDIRIELTSPPGNAARAFFNSCHPLLKVTVDADVFDTGGGDVYACFDPSGLPWKGIVENVLELGDVRGRMREAKVPAP